MDMAFLGGFLSATAVAVVSATLSRRSQLTLAREEQRRELCEQIESLLEVCAKVSEKHALGKLKTAKAGRMLTGSRDTLCQLLAGRGEILLSKSAQQQGWSAAEHLERTIRDISYKPVFRAPYFLLNALSEERLRAVPWVRWRQFLRSLQRAKWPIRKFLLSGHFGGSLILGAIYSREDVLLPAEAFEEAIRQAALLEQKAPDWNIRFDWQDRGDGYVGVSWSVYEPHPDYTRGLSWFTRNSQHRFVRRFGQALPRAVRKATNRKLKEVFTSMGPSGSLSTGVKDYEPTVRPKREPGVAVPLFYL